MSADHSLPESIFEAEEEGEGDRLEEAPSGPSFAVPLDENVWWNWPPAEDADASVARR